jgi:hypothetical protein
MRYVECYPTLAWYCGQSVGDQFIEAAIVEKIGPDEGGVLCCKN